MFRQKVTKKVDYHFIFGDFKTFMTEEALLKRTLSVTQSKLSTIEIFFGRLVSTEVS
jgi:hypothetical protein